VPYPDSLAFLIVGLVDILIFAGFVTAGLYFRRHAELHKRLMLLAMLILAAFPIRIAMD
jgi:hypothetical protein